MTIRKFFKIYSHYKNNFDREMLMRRNGVTYTKLNELEMKEEEWL